jgi:peptide/nickel transport system substrate-binding protein
MSRTNDRELMSLVDGFLAGEIDRRSLARRMGKLAGGAMFGGALAGVARANAAPLDRRVAPRDARFQNATPTPGGTVVAAIVDKPVNMDPAFSQLYSSMQVYENIFNSLVDVDADYNFIPSLAKSWTQIDPVTWEFDLVDNATFHNGEPFTSRDVAFTVERTLDPDQSFPNAASLRFIDSVETDGDYKVRFNLNQPWGSFLAELVIWLEIVNEKAINAANPKLEPVGTGPFRMTEWVQDDHITLERWGQYHVPDRPFIDTLIFRSISDDTVRLTGLQTGELQWIQQVPLQRVEELKADESDEITVSDAKPFLPDFLYLNCSLPPFDDVRVRQAVAACIDRAQIVQVAYANQASPAFEVAAEISPFYSGLNAWADGPDYERARQLLAEAGQEGLTFDFDGQPQVATQLVIAQVIQQQLSQAGITMNIQNYESGDWITRLNSKEYVATVSYYSVTIDPAQFYNRKLRSDSAGNTAGYASPEMDELLDAWVGESDVAARAEAYANVVAKVQEDVPLLSLDHQFVQYWTPVNVHGVEPVPSIKLRMQDIFFAE